MKKAGNGIALILAAVCALGGAAFRIWLAVSGTDFVQKGGYVLIGVLVLAVLMIYVLNNLTDHRQINLHSRPMNFVTALFCAMTGVSMLLQSVLDGLTWKVKGITPLPNYEITGTIDEVTLTVALICGVLGGLYLVYLAMVWTAGGRVHRVFSKLGTLLPVLWAVARLARYDLSYNTAGSFLRTFYDSFMLIFTLLFLLQFARFAANVSDKPLRQLIPTAICCCMFSLLGGISAFGFDMLGDATIRVTATATVPDVMMALLSGTTAVSLMLPKKEKVLKNI